jgi:TonB system transport protein ExbD (group 1)
MGAQLSATPQGSKNPFPANSEMNVTPFVDVMLVLLIIFMIAAPLSTVTVPVDLPTASSKPLQVKPPDPIFVSIEKDGKVYVMDEAVTLETLPEKLRDKMQGSTDERVYLRADQNLAYRIIMEVMNQLQDSGFTKVALVAEEKTEAAKAKAGS